MRLFIATFACLSLVGCGLFGESLTPEEKQERLRSLTETAVALALTEIYEDVAERREAAELFKGYAEALLNEHELGPNSGIFIIQTFASVPPEYIIYLRGVTRLLERYTPYPDIADAILTDNELDFLIAVFVGIADGCDLVIASLGPPPS